jgi:hypothetical protein
MSFDGQPAWTINRPDVMKAIFSHRPPVPCDVQYILKSTEIKLCSTMMVTRRTGKLLPRSVHEVTEVLSEEEFPSFISTISSLD